MSHEEDLQLVRALVAPQQKIDNNIGGDSTPKWAIVVMVVAVAAIAIMYVKTDSARAVADAQISAAEYKRATDLERMSELRAKVATLEQYRQQHADRLNELEKQNVPDR